MESLKFKYYDSFRCTGAECTDSCCRHWNIMLTKKEYFRYKKMECSPELSELFETSFKRTRSDSDACYVKMKLKEDGSCPFLGEDSLCRIQKELGEQALSIICSLFPRNITGVGSDAVVFSCTANCSRIVEMLMDYPQGLELEESPYDGKNRFVENKINTLKISEEWQGYPYIWDIYNAQIDILQNRRFSLSERMLILGYFSKKADEYLKDSPEKIPALVQNLNDNELCAQIAQSLFANQSKEQASAKAAIMLTKLTKIAEGTSMNLLEERLFDKLKKSTGLIAEGTYSKFTVMWNEENIEKLREQGARIEEEMPHFFENLLVNKIFQDDIAGNGVWNVYMQNVIYLTLLRYLMPAFLPDDCGRKDIAVATTYISKLFDNLDYVKKLIVAAMEGNSANDLAHAAFYVCS